MELANAKWLGHNPSGLLGQFATTGGYTSLIEAANAEDYPTLHQFFEDGVTGDVDLVRAELLTLSNAASADVASCARAMR